MIGWELPTSIDIDGTSFKIRTDYRVILDILAMCQDSDLPEEAKAQGVLEILYEDYEKILSLDKEHLKEALSKANAFIDCGMKDDGTKKPRLMDWEGDAPILVPAINAVAGKEVRAEPYIHWWTFMGWYMEIHEGLFSQVLSIRQKKSKGKKLEKHEMEFYRSNRNMIDLGRKKSEKEMEEERRDKEALEKLWGK